MANNLFENYLKEIYRKIERGDAREESFYSSLEKLLTEYGQELRKDAEVTTSPKKSEAGNPDFRVWDGQSEITGYIEAKEPSTDALDRVEKSDQLTRYRNAYPNIILTNFFEFRLYRNGVLWDKPVKISDYNLSKKIPKLPVVQHEEEFKKLLDFFFDFTQPRITHPKTLAEVLAYKAEIMRDYVVLPILKESKENYFGWLYQSFRKHLIKDLEEDVFADLFSQTFTYGLVIAKYQFEAQQTLFGQKTSDLPFTTKTAYDFIQEKFGILREVFKIISTQKMPKDLEIITDDIVDILNHTEIYKLLTRSSKGGKKDPIFHLYETFLLKYDKERKIKLGVFYTPLEVVSYIVNSVHVLLKDDKLFDAPDGLANYKPDSIEKSVTLLDPAVGTGTFFVDAIEKAVEEVKIKRSSSRNIVSDFVRKHILPHFFAFEIQIAPYVVSHLKVLFTLTDEGFSFADDDWLRVFLTNTLDFHHKEANSLLSPLEQKLSEEQEKALDVKNKTPIMVVVGNPPYSVSSQNEVDPETKFGKFYESYKENVRKEEKNIQPLSDDYIKFLAFAHWKVKRTGKGIVGMITNNSYLDGIIHRDMREKLLDDFDLVYVLNLHGDAKRPKISEDGKKDENVFDIRQGVTISLFVKPEKKVKKQIFYQDLIGPREAKYKYLDTHDAKISKWEKLKPKDPYWFFVPKDFESGDQYRKFLPINEVFDKTSSGVKTHRDNFIVDSSRDELKRKLKMFTDFENYDNSLLKQAFKLKDTKTWDLDKARTKVDEEGIENTLLKEYAYRPFDTRWTYQSKVLIDRQREDYLWKIGALNPALVTTRQLSNPPFKHAFVIDATPDICLISLKTKESSYIFPLWLYEDRGDDGTQQQNLLDGSGSASKIPNIKRKIIDLMSSTYDKKLSPEEIFYYIYAILYSEEYRKRYEEFLKIDFPRIPFTKDYQTFKKLSGLGKQLVELHLLKSSLLNETSARFEGGDERYIEKPRYDEKQKQIYVNDVQYFTNVELEVWNYHIGGYQVLNKWLKDRIGKEPSDKLVDQYIKIITAIGNTIELQKQIDKLYPKVEKNLIGRWIELKTS